MPRKAGARKMIRRRPGAKRRGGYKKRFATKTYSFKRWAKTVYLVNSDTEDPTKLVSDDLSVQVGSSVADALVGTYQVGGVFVNSLSDVVNSAEFTTLFDQYRIAGIKIRISPMINVNSAVTGNEIIPEMWVHRDMDDVAVPTSQNDMRQYQDTKIFRLNRTINLYCKPRALIAQDGTAAAIVPFGKVGRSMFLDCNEDTVVHPSFKFYLRNLTLSASARFALRIDTCFYTLFKNVR